jgi:linoleoyl-CoA desaturase
MLSGVVTSIPVMLGLWFIMGVGVSGIGLSVMHDANHQAYSKSKKVNSRLGYLMNLLGSYHLLWKIQHNVLHHSYTNVDGHDEDIEISVMRFSPNQKGSKWFRFQAFYASFAYCLMTLYKTFVKDFEQLNRYNKMGLVEGQGLTMKKAVAEIIFIKTAYLTIFVALPIILVPLPASYIVLGWLIMHFVAGLFLTLVFQPAHVIEETDFAVPSQEENSVENGWAIHQMMTTANFAHENKALSWFIGGLNYQVEHHLFPTICHVHYREIAPIVRDTAKEFGIPYHEHKTFIGALGSHFRMIHKLGQDFNAPDKLAYK